MDNLSYRPFGMAQSMSVGESATVNVQNIYDQAGRLKVANQGAAKELSYTYDANGNLKSKTATGLNEDGYLDKHFSYDNLNRVTNAQGLLLGDIGYTYDNVGNRLTRTLPNGILTKTDAFTYVNGTNKIDKMVPGNAASVNYQKNYRYDSNGNIIFTYPEWYIPELRKAYGCGSFATCLRTVFNGHKIPRFCRIT